jgi:hypothetical protein
MNDTNCAHCLALQAEVARLTQEQERAMKALVAAHCELWQTYGGTPRLTPLFEQIESALRTPPAALASLPHQDGK